MHARDRRAAISIIDTLTAILRAELDDDAPATWPVLAALLRHHLDGKSLSITALADVSGLPRTTARRIAFSLKQRGWLHFRPVARHGGRETVMPSEALLDRLDRLTEQTVRLVVGASDAASFDRFDAASLAPAPAIAWPRAAPTGFDDTIELTLIAYEDPVFDIIRRNRSDIERFLGMHLQVLSYPQEAYPRVLREALADGAAAASAARGPVLVALPFPWLAECCADARLRPLDALQAASSLRGTDFYDAVWRAGQVQGRLHAIALQPTLDFLWYRQDLFEAEGLAPPRTFDDVVRCAERLQRRSAGRAGISWNAAPGLPLAESFLQILGAQGGMRLDGGVPDIDREAGRAVIDYLRALIPYSPPNLRGLSWVRNAEAFGSGRAAMCYHWSNRYGMLDSHTLLQKGGRIGLQPHPTRDAAQPSVAPLGGALLAIPANQPDSDAALGWRAIETLASPELMKYFVLNGAAGNARPAVAEDPYVRQRNRVISEIDELAKRNAMAPHPSPAMPRYHDVTAVLSTHLESLLFEPRVDIGRGLGALQDALAVLAG